MPIYALIITILILAVCYLIYRLERAGKEKIVVLVTQFDDVTSWKIFDSEIEADAFIKLYAKSECRCAKIRTSDIVFKAN